MELGVSMPYLEEEIEILEAAGVLKKKSSFHRYYFRNVEPKRNSLVLRTELQNHQTGAVV